MDQDLDARLKELEKKVDDMAAIMQRVWAIYKWTMIATVALIVLLLIGLAFAIPAYLKAIDLNGLLG